MVEKIRKWKSFFLTLFSIYLGFHCMMFFVYFWIGGIIGGTICHNINVSKIPQSYVDNLETYFFEELTDEVELVEYKRLMSVSELPFPYCTRQMLFKVSSEYKQSVLVEGSFDNNCSSIGRYGRTYYWRVESFSDDGYILASSPLHLSDINGYTQTVCENIEGMTGNYTISYYLPPFGLKSMGIFTFLFMCLLILFVPPLVFLLPFLILRSRYLKLVREKPKS